MYELSRYKDGRRTDMCKVEMPTIQLGPTIRVLKSHIDENGVRVIDKAEIVEVSIVQKTCNRPTR